jgi:hypothetical protein
MELEAAPPIKEASPVKVPSIASVLGILLMNTICVVIF